MASDALSDLFLGKVKEVLGLEFTRNAVHVGLESAYFHKLNPELPIVTVGMEIRDPHSVSERVKVDTIVPFTRLLGAVLEAWNG